MPTIGFLFDMDGVIVDTNRYHRLAIHEFCHAHGISVSEEYLREKVYGRVNREWIPALFGEMDENECNQLADEKEARFREIYKPHMQALPGLESFLLAMRNAGIPAVLATSAPAENASFVLEGLGLVPYFSDVLSSVDVKTGKPDPEIYLLAASRIGLEPAKCVVFEDSLAGVESGLGAGCHVVAITTTHTENELRKAHFTSKDFQTIEIADIVEFVYRKGNQR